MIAEPPVAPPANATDTCCVPTLRPAVTELMVGAAGGVLYANGDAFVSDPLLVPVSKTGPTAVGVTVNVCAADELVKVSTVAVESPPPEGVIVMLPEYAPFGVTVKLLEAALSKPPEGPLRL